MPDTQAPCKQDAIRWLSVRNWDRYQHYAKRRPPWIKLYNDLLDDYEFRSLSETGRFHLLLIFLLASRTENRIPCDDRYLQSVLPTDRPIDLDELVAARFLVPLHVEHGDSAVQASCKQSDSNVRALARGGARSVSHSVSVSVSDSGEGGPGETRAAGQGAGGRSGDRLTDQGGGVVDRSEGLPNQHPAIDRVLALHRKRHGDEPGIGKVANRERIARVLGLVGTRGRTLPLESIEAAYRAIHRRYDAQPGMQHHTLNTLFGEKFLIGDYLEAASAPPPPAPTPEPEAPERLVVCEGAWGEALEELSGEVPPGAFEAYVERLTYLGHSDDVLWLGCSSDYARGMIRRQWADQILRAYNVQIDEEVDCCERVVLTLAPAEDPGADEAAADGGHDGSERERASVAAESATDIPKEAAS